MNDLFDIPESKSPRLRWMEKHGIVTHHAEHLDDEELPWSAWLKTMENGNGIPEDPESLGYGKTQDEAIVHLAKRLGIRLWNEEGRP